VLNISKVVLQVIKDKKTKKIVIYIGQARFFLYKLDSTHLNLCKKAQSNLEKKTFMSTFGNQEIFLFTLPKNSNTQTVAYGYKFRFGTIESSQSSTLL